jgi:poly(A) polymerase
MEAVAMELARAVAQRLRAAGHEVYLVGGCVRDRLLSRPCHDFDLTTGAPPGEVCRLFPDAVEVGAHFGVVLIRRPGAEVQVATYRSEDSYADGRHPGQVRFETDVRRDVERRDFTINALLEDPLTGQVFDYTGGLDDLRQGVIRAIGDPRQRFAEDHLRMLRAVRFAARLGFQIEAGTMAAIQSLAAHIASISAERVRDELTRILTEGAARRGFELLDESGLLAVVLPEVKAMQGVAQPPEFHPEGDVWIHTLGLLERVEPDHLELALGCLLHDVGKPPSQTFEDRIRFTGHERVGATMARQMLTRLRYPGEVIDAVESLVAQHMKFRDAPKMGLSTFKRFARQPLFDTLLELHRLDLLASQRPLTNYDAVRGRRDDLSEEQLRPEPLLRGRDLIAMGYQPGPAFARVLHLLEEQQLEGRLATPEQAMAFVRRVWEQASTSESHADAPAPAPGQCGSERPS